VVARVDGEPVYASDAFGLIHLSAPEEAENAVRQLVIDRLCAAEAAAGGASVPQDAVERELARQIAELERKVKEASKGQSDLASHVKSTLGLEPPAYFELLRGSVERSLLLERVVLFELSRRPRTQLRLIRVKERRLAQEVRGKLEQGADFAALARLHSEDGSAREGGVYPPLPDDLPSPLLEKARTLAAGALSAVEEVSTPDGPRYRIVQVLARLPPESGSFAQKAASLEQVLAGRPLSPLELEAWMRIMEERHRIRLFRLGREDDGA
jgi:parvulin-like peptidyl-prolyl isomerase